MKTIKNNLKLLLKRNKFILRVYNLYLFLHITSPAELFYVLRNAGKLRLISEVIYYTQVTHRRLITLNRLASRYEKREINGSFIECGVRNGGSAAVIAAAARKNDKRHVWLFDSWRDCPSRMKETSRGIPKKRKRDWALAMKKR